MASDSNTDVVRGNYARLSDEELIRIISQEAHGLTDEAVEIIREELAKRRLDPKLKNVIDAQNKHYSTEELDELAEAVRPLACPKCQSEAQPLAAVSISKTVSFVVATQTHKQLYIACPGCLKSECNSSTAITLLAGWWCFPWGPIRTVQSLANNFKVYRAIKVPGPNDNMRQFIRGNIGLFELHKGKKDNIQTILYNLYNKDPLNKGLKVLRA